MIKKFNEFAGRLLALFVAVLSVASSLLFSPATALAAVNVVELGGETRYETAVEQALYSHPSSEWVIVASGENYVDSLAASGLAGTLDCPILLTKRTSVPQVTLDAIRSMGASKIIVLGQTDAVSGAVESTLRQLGSVTRLGGSTRYGTQEEIFRFARSLGAFSGGKAFVASGVDFADALAVSPLSYGLHTPVFFVDETGSLPASQLSALKESGASEIVVLGGTEAVSAAGYQQVSAVASQNGGSVTRLAGETRYETSVQIANYAVSRCGYTWSGVAFASGTAPFDSLGGGVVQGESKSVLLLASEGNLSTMARNVPAGSVSSMKFFGGENVFSKTVRKAACAIVGVSYTTGTPIMGTTNVTGAQLAAYYRSMVGDSTYPSSVYSSRGAATIEDFCNILVEESKTEGVRAEVVFAQMVHETGWLRFGGAVKAEQCNFAGLGAVNSSPTDANTFPDVRTGLRAQIQHLKAYASTEPLVNECVDVRFDFVSRGCAPNLEDLNGKWAVPGNGYGEKIAKTIDDIFASIK